VLDTVPVIDSAARRVIPSMPPLTPNTPLDKHLRHIKALIPVSGGPETDAALSPKLHPMPQTSRFDVYTAAVQKARYAEAELGETEFVDAMEAAEWLLGILDVYYRVLRERTTTTS